MLRLQPLATALTVAVVAVAPSAAHAAIDIAAHPGTGLGEPEVRVNPLDPDNIVIGENNTGVSVSHDGGLTFTQHAIENPGDNVLAVQPNGRFVYTSLDGQVHVSSDGGDRWTTVGNWVGAVASHTDSARSVPGGTVALREVACSAPEEEGPDAVVPAVEPDKPGPQLVGCDRPWLAADAQTGRLYVSFTDHNDASAGALTIPWELSDIGCRATVLTNPLFQCGRQYVSSSKDDGHSWSRFFPMDTATYGAYGTGGFSGGPVAAHGVLATAYSATGPRCKPCVLFETSSDGGEHWAQHRTPAAVVPAELTTLDASLLFQPYVAADPSRPGRYAIAVFNHDRNQLLVYVTADSGRTWSGPARLGVASSQALYLPWVAYGPTGALGVLWRAAYADGSYAAWAAVSAAGTTRFTPPVQLSSAPSPGPAYQLAGDDGSSVALGARSLYAAWGDRRGGSLGIHFGRYDFSP